jgi:uncharacterized protein
MSATHKVWVEKNAYRIKGEFSTIEANEQIRNQAGALCGVTNPRRLEHIHSYGGEARFFQGLADGKLLGTRCDNTKCESKGSVYIPFRIYCPDCLKKMKIVDLTAKAKKAKIYSYVVTSRTGAFNTLKTPIKFIDVQIEGTVTILKSYMLVGEPAIGGRVVPVFKIKPTYTIMDLAWVAAGTKTAPKGYKF